MSGLFQRRRAPEPVPELDPEATVALMPHCDQRVLHKPLSCEACDRFPEYQQYRELLGIAYTGEEPAGYEVPCPATLRRPLGDIEQWPGNRVRPPQ